MNEPDYCGAVAYALTRLKNELSAKLTYHNFWHTHEDVLPASQRLARSMGVSAEDLQLLEVAAVFHDFGFLEKRANHEMVGARMVAQVLPGFGFSGRQIEAVIGMIMATRLPQSPCNLLEEILADADLAVLGRQDFMVRNAALRQERANFGQTVPLKRWCEQQVAFLKDHAYFTAVAQTLYNKSKQQNIALLEETLKSPRNM